MTSPTPDRPSSTPPLRQAVVDSVKARCPEGATRPVAEVFPPPKGGYERVSAFTFVVLDDGTVGMAYNLLDGDDQRAAYDAHDWGGYVGWDAQQLADELLADEPHRRIAGYAACIALSQRIYRRERPAGLDTASNLTELLDPGPGDRVGVVGYARGMAKHLLERGAQVVIVERRAIEPPEGVEWGSDPALLEPCNKVFITSSTILNDTLDEILSHCRAASWRALYGPGAAILPDALLARGVNALGGLLVTDGAALVARQRAGKKWRDAKQEYVLSVA
ncbi:MAG: hypothetical protein JRI68_31745 [Deltaproteobacteria bacterium]|nr:hypothetical protein [Deltaproteobacteria bacterium]